MSRIHNNYDTSAEYFMKKGYIRKKTHISLLKTYLTQWNVEYSLSLSLPGCGRMTGLLELAGKRDQTLFRNDGVETY